MPHFILEYSSNVAEEINFAVFFDHLHNLLIEDKLFKIDDIKSRAIPLDNYYAGDGNSDNCFIAANLTIMPGRSAEIKKMLSNKILDFLKSEFHASLNSLNCNITVKIDEIDSECYSRFKSKVK